MVGVPENTLLRWMSGRAQMPLQAFLNLVELLARQEKAEAGASSEAIRKPPAGDAPHTLRMGLVDARCARCDGTAFRAADPSAPLLYTAGLECVACGERVVHGDLISSLAKEAVRAARATTAARTRRQAVAKP